MVSPHISAAQNPSYCFLGGVVLGHNVQDPTDDELHEEVGKMSETAVLTRPKITEQMNHIFKIRNKSLIRENNATNQYSQCDTMRENCPHAWSAVFHNHHR